MQYAQLKGIPNVTVDDIYTGNGVSELINLCMSALLDNGDEILIPSPDYPLWTACANLAGGQSRPLYLPMNSPTGIRIMEDIQTENHGQNQSHRNSSTPTTPPEPSTPERSCSRLWTVAQTNIS